VEDLLVDSTILESNLRCPFCILSPKVLHDSLGHPHLSKLKKIVPQHNRLNVLKLVMSTKETS